MIGPQGRKYITMFIGKGLFEFMLIWAMNTPIELWSVSRHVFLFCYTCKSFRLYFPGVLINIYTLKTLLFLITEHFSVVWNVTVINDEKIQANILFQQITIEFR